MIKQIFSLELLEQRKKVEKEWEKVQALVDNEIEDTTFIWCPDSNHLLITDDIFWKEKRIREEDVEDEENIPLILEVEDSQSFPSFVKMVEQQTSTAPHLNQIFMFTLGL
jgi:hypothetical protein